MSALLYVPLMISAGLMQWSGPSVSPDSKDARLEACTFTLIGKRASYPKYEQRRGIGGRSVVRVHYDGSGRIVSTEIAQTSGSAGLDKAALKAAQTWKVVSNCSSMTGGEQTVPIFFQP